MINNTGLTVTLQLDDKLTAGMNKALQNVTKNMDNVGKSMVTVGRSINQVSRNMAFLGTAIVGPMALAFKTASKYSTEVSDSLKRLGNSTIEIQNTIATAMIPVVDKLSQEINKLTTWFNNLNPKMRDSVIQGTLVTGMVLLLGSGILKVAASIDILIGKLLIFSAAGITLNPVMLAVVVALVAIGTALTLVIKNLDHIQSFATSTYSFFENLADKAKLAIPYLKEIKEFFSDEKVKGVFAKVPEMSIDAVLGMFGIPKGVIDQVRNYLASITQEQALEPITIKTTGIQLALQDFALNFKQTFTEAYNSAVNIGQQSANILVSQINMFSSRFGQAFSDMIMKGKNFGESMKAMFTDMVASLIAAVVQMLVQWVIYQAAQWVLVTASVAMAKTIEAAWAGAAAMVSLATMGANSVGAMAGIAATRTMAAIPMLAEGGIVTRPTLAMIGERGPEAVVPLGKGGAGTVINIEINNPNVSNMSDIDTLTEEISRRLNAEIERL